MLLCSVTVSLKNLQSHLFGRSGFPDANGRHLKRYHPVFSTTATVLPPSREMLIVEQPEINAAANIANRIFFISTLPKAVFLCM
jgi:hypothetical protein